MQQILPARWPDTPPEAPSADILFFGALSEVFGCRWRIGLPPQGCLLSELRDRLAGLSSGGDAILNPGVRTALDREMTSADVWVRPGQEAAFFSPGSGGRG